TWVPSPGTDIAIVTVGLQVQLSYVGQFDPVVIHLKNQKIAELLKNKVYVDQIMFPDEMASRGLKPGFADLIISPKPPYHFHLPNTKLKVARGQHDSLAEEAQHIAAFMWGKDIKKGFLCTDIIHNYDFTPTMARLLGINAPLDATGKVLYTVFEDISPSQDYTVQFDDEEAIASENTEKIWDEEASGRTVTSLYNRSAWLEFDNLPAAEKIVVKYAAADDGKLSLYVNNQFVRDIFFPAIDEGIGKYDYKRINLALNKGDTLRLVNESSHDAGIWIDNIVLFTNDKNEAVTENGGTDFLLNPQ
ncbi:MAG TPA: hypothetical protein DDW50_11115, partial [Firmicutes bacterium]|nr:hypothetical protein [Bacillota bacterium]